MKTYLDLPAMLDVTITASDGKIFIAQIIDEDTDATVVVDYSQVREVIEALQQYLVDVAASQKA